MTTSVHAVVGAPTTHYPADACAAWRRKWDNPFPSWRTPVGLEKYATFVRGWGFLMHGGFGWVLIDPALCVNGALTGQQKPEGGMVS
jgi:hypothetical protein